MSNRSLGEHARASLVVAGLAVLISACAVDAADSGGASGAGVGQGGAQDFGQFRAILEAGEIPGPETIDDVGFFNEHKIELPPPDCGNDVCIHGRLGVMGNMISGSNCTLVLLGMNTPIDPATLERPPLNLVIAIDTSGSMHGQSMSYVREGLFRMLDDIQAGDRVSLVKFDDQATVLVEAVDGTNAELELAIAKLQAGGKTNLYDGLRTAYDVVAAYAEPGLQNRVILLSDGVATAGIVDDERLIEMSTRYNEVGYALTTIGMGDSFDPELMRRLAEGGSGAFYFLEDPAAVQEVFEEEVRTFLVPLAEDVRIDLDVDGGYALRAIYGTKLFGIADDVAFIDIPTVQIAHRTSVDDDAGGRRGGGGAILAELVPQTEGDVEVPGTVGQITMTYRVPGSDEIVAQSVRIESPLRPGETPEEGLFDDAGVEKAFVMLNIYAGFEMAATRAAIGDDQGALGVLLPLRDSVAAWDTRNMDADIADDLRYIDMFVANLRARGAENPPPHKNPPNPWPHD